MGIFEWFNDWWDDWFFEPFFEEPEEVKKKREEYLKARREAREKALEEYRKKREERLAGTTAIIPFGDTEEAFRGAVEQYAKEHPEMRVEGTSVSFPNGYFRSLRIEKKEEKKE